MPSSRFDKIAPRLHTGPRQKPHKTPSFVIPTRDAVESLKMFDVRLIRTKWILMSAWSRSTSHPIRGALDDRRRGFPRIDKTVVERDPARSRPCGPRWMDYQLCSESDANRRFVSMRCVPTD